MFQLQDQESDYDEMERWLQQHEEATGAGKKEEPISSSGQTTLTLYMQHVSYLVLKFCIVSLQTKFVMGQQESPYGWPDFCLNFPGANNLGSC